MINFEANMTREAIISPPASPFSHFQDTSYFPLLKKYHQSPEWFYVTDSNGQIVASWLLFSTPLNYVTPPESKVLRWLDVHYAGFHSPLFSEELSQTDRKRVATLLLEKVKERLSRLRPLSTNITLNPILTPEEIAFWKSAIETAGLTWEETASYITEIPETEALLVANIKPDRRTSYRKGMKLGLEFCLGSSEEDLLKYSELRAENQKRNGFSPTPWNHFKDTFDCLSNTNIYRFFLAKLQGRVGAGQLAFCFGNYVYLSGVSTAHWTKVEKIPANDFLQFELLLWAQRNGYRYVDFVGAHLKPESSKHKNIDYFKSRWGSTLQKSLRLNFPASKLRRLAHRGFSRMIQN